MMDAVVLKATGDVSQLERTRIAIPPLQPHQVQLRVSACGICYRDVLDRQGAFPFIKTPTILGHEIAGVVEQVGNSVTSLRSGDRVVTLHWEPCNKCEFCVAGASTLCKERNKTFIALSQNGGYAERCVIGASALVQCAMPSAVDAAVVACTYGTTWKDE
jgi:D-arabinose 1-dehydrogenase-like Zn-dependent alcohol dehydrogenase